VTRLRLPVSLRRSARRSGGRQAVVSGLRQSLGHPTSTSSGNSNRRSELTDFVGGWERDRRRPTGRLSRTSDAERRGLAADRRRGPASDRRRSATMAVAGARNTGRDDADNDDVTHQVVRLCRTACRYSDVTCRIRSSLSPVTNRQVTSVVVANAKLCRRGGRLKG